jgi:hypothetical protein
MQFMSPSFISDRHDVVHLYFQFIDFRNLIISYQLDVLLNSLTAFAHFSALGSHHAFFIIQN